MSLKIKFIGAVLGCLIVLASLGGFYLNDIQNKTVEEELLAHAEIINKLAQSDKNNINPLLPEYSYRQISNNSKGYLDLADSFEDNLIQKFTIDPELKKMSGYTNNKEKYYLAVSSTSDRQKENFQLNITYIPTQQIIASHNNIGNSILSVFLIISAINLLIIYSLFDRFVTMGMSKIIKTISRVDRDPRTYKKIEYHYNDELGKISRILNRILTSHSKIFRIQEAEKRQTKLLSIINDFPNTEQEKTIYQDLLTEITKVLQVDRAIIYTLKSDLTGEIFADSCNSNFNIETDGISEQLYQIYREVKVISIDNFNTSDSHPEHLQLLQKLNSQTSVTLPIQTKEGLDSLLIISQSLKSRNWQQIEIDYLLNLVARLTRVKEYSQLLNSDRKLTSELEGNILNFLQDIEAASSGDLTVRAEMGSGHIAIVADFFNSIIENLRDIVIQVQEATNKVNDSIEENEGAISQVAKEAQIQASQISQTLSAVEKMTNSIQEVATNAKKAAQISRSASDAAENGGDAVQQSVESIQQLRSTVASTAKKVKRLGESSQEISKVVSLINQIAMQTNMLAINASIEASRAGEEGRGFAVVAEEIGELAIKSSQATTEIEEIVENIQEETQEVVAAMEVGTTQVVEGSRLVKTTKDNLETIQQISYQIDRLLQSISGLTISQTATSQNVTKLMQQVAKSQEKTSFTSIQVSDSLKTTVAIAQKLESSVDTFKV